MKLAVVGEAAGVSVELAMPGSDLRRGQAPCLGEFSSARPTPLLLIEEVLVKLNIGRAGRAKSWTSARTRDSLTQRLISTGKLPVTTT